MPKVIQVPLSSSGYNIFIGSNELEKIGLYIKRLKIGKDAIVITNPNIQKLHGKYLALGLKAIGCSIKVFEVPEGEKSKSAKEAMKLVEKIAEYDVGKEIFVVAFGGGVVGDLAGYVAAIYKRGVPYIQVPTTLLAQIDSAIGGKVAIDLPVGKNLVGAFYQPKLVFSDISVLKTLSRRQMQNGFAEAIKYGIIRDVEFFNYILNNFEKAFLFDVKVLKEIVLNCSRIKVAVVLDDEKETKGIRTILNFGHTVGHAIETVGGFDRYHHGEAIALGMRVAAKISNKMLNLSLRDVEKINNILTVLGLPEKIDNIKTTDILKIMKHDKKFVGGKNRFVLVRSIGKVKVVDSIPKTIISEAIQSCR